MLGPRTNLEPDAQTFAHHLEVLVPLQALENPLVFKKWLQQEHRSDADALAAAKREIKRLKEAIKSLEVVLCSLDSLVTCKAVLLSLLASTSKLQDQEWCSNMASAGA